MKECLKKQKKIHNHAQTFLILNQTFLNKQINNDIYLTSKNKFINKYTNFIKHLLLANDNC